MKRMTLIAAALCLVMITTVGAGVVAAKQTEDPLRHAGASGIYLYDVKATEMHGTGKLQIDTAKHTFVFNGKDFPPSQLIELKARAVGSTDYVAFATGETTPSGNLHIAGTWEKDAAPAEVLGATAITAKIWSMKLANDGPTWVRLGFYYSTDGGATWLFGGVSPWFGYGKSDTVGFHDINLPDGALVKVCAQVWGDTYATMGSEVFQYDSQQATQTKSCVLYSITGSAVKPTLTYLGLYFV